LSIQNDTLLLNLPEKNKYCDLLLYIVFGIKGGRLYKLQFRYQCQSSESSVSKSKAIILEVDWRFFLLVAIND